MVYKVVRMKEISSAGLRSIWKTTKSTLLWKKHVETTNLKQNWIFGTTKKIYKIDSGYYIEPEWQIYRKMSHSDPIRVILSRTTRATNFSIMQWSSVFGIWMVRYFADMTISMSDLENSWSKSQASSGAKVICETNRPIYSHCFCFVQIKPCILKT